MPIKIRKSPYYVDQKIGFIDKGLGGRIGMLEVRKPPPPVYLSGSTYIVGTFEYGIVGQRSRPLTGISGETWTLGYYYVPEEGIIVPERKFSAPVLSESVFSYVPRALIWRIDGEATNEVKYYSAVTDDNATVGQLRDSVFPDSFISDDGDFWTAGTNISAAGDERVVSIVTVFSASNTVSSTLLQQDASAALFKSDMTGVKFASAGLSNEGYKCWKMDASTGEVSGTVLTDPRIVDSRIPPTGLAIDLDGNVFASSTDYTVSVSNQDVSGTLWKVDGSTGQVSTLFLSSSSPDYYDFTFAQVALSTSRELPAWVAASCNTDVGTRGVMAWKVSDMVTESSGTVLLDPNEDNNLFLQDIKVDASGDVWVLGNPAIGILAAVGKRPISEGKCVLWKLSGDPTSVSGTIIESGDPSFPSTYGNSLTVTSIDGNVVPFVALSCFDVDLIATRAKVAVLDTATGDVSQIPLDNPDTLDLPPIEIGTSERADSVTVDTNFSPPSIRVAGTVGYDGFSPEYDTRQAFWKLNGSNPLLSIQALTLRAVSGTLP